MAPKHTYVLKDILRACYGVAFVAVFIHGFIVVGNGVLYPDNVPQLILSLALVLGSLKIIWICVREAEAAKNKTNDLEDGDEYN